MFAKNVACVWRDDHHGERFWKEVKIRVHVAELRYIYLREFHG